MSKNAFIHKLQVIYAKNRNTTLLNTSLKEWSQLFILLKNRGKESDLQFWNSYFMNTKKKIYKYIEIDD